MMMSFLADYWPFIVLLLIAAYTWRGPKYVAVYYEKSHWPDEAYLPSGRDYEKHYWDLAHAVEQQLGPYIGAIPGPHPLICAACEAAGKCVCTMPLLWTEGPDAALFVAVNKLKEYDRLHNLGAGAGGAVPG